MRRSVEGCGGVWRVFCGLTSYLAERVCVVRCALCVAAQCVVRGCVASGSGSGGGSGGGSGREIHT